MLAVPGIEVVMDVFADQLMRGSEVTYPPFTIPKSKNDVSLVSCTSAFAASAETLAMRSRASGVGTGFWG